MHASNGDRAASQAGWAGNQSDDGEWDYQDQDHPPPSYEEVEKQQQHQQRQQR
jgi:hypothetical protein